MLISEENHRQWRMFQGIKSKLKIDFNKGEQESVDDLISYELILNNHSDLLIDKKTIRRRSWNKWSGTIKVAICRLTFDEQVGKKLGFF